MSYLILHNKYEPKLMAKSSSSPLIQVDSVNEYQVGAPLRSTVPTSRVMMSTIFLRMALTWVCWA